MDNFVGFDFKIKYIVHKERKGRMTSCEVIEAQLCLFIELFLIKLRLFSCINFAPDFMVMVLISFLEEWVDKNFLVHPSVNFPEVIHIELTNERTPVGMPKVLG